MARRTWNRCGCGVKLHVKGGGKICFKCSMKKRNDSKKHTS